MWINSYNELKMMFSHSSQIIRCCRVFSLAVGVSIQKKRETVLVARPTHRGSGIAHRSWTSKLAEPHAEYDTSTDNARALSAYWRWLLIFALASTCLLHSWLQLLKFSRFQIAKKERRVNAFPNVFAESLPRCPLPGCVWLSAKANLHSISLFAK